MSLRYFHTLKHLSSIEYNILIKQVTSNVIYNPFTGKPINNVNPMVFEEVIDNFFPEEPPQEKTKNKTPQEIP